MSRLSHLLLAASLIAFASGPVLAQDSTVRRPPGLGSELGNFGLAPFFAVPNYALTDEQTAELRALEDRQLAERRALEDRFAAEMRALLATQARERTTLLADLAQR